MKRTLVDQNSSVCQDSFLLNMGSHQLFSKQFGNDNKNLVLSGSVSHPPPTLGADATFNMNKHSASLGATHTPGFGSTLTGGGSLNLVNQNPHRLDANTFHTRTFPNHGSSFGTTGGGLTYANANGHGVSGSVSHTPAFKYTEISAQANINLYKGVNSSLDAYAGRSQGHGPSGWNKPNHFGGVSFSKKF